jgi:hypothetical protein
MNNKSLKKINNIIVLFLGAFLFLFTGAYASVISINNPSKVSVGDRVSIDIYLDPENQSINSVESTINFSKDLFDFNGFSNKQSSIPIWVEEPREKDKGAIHFSGVIPGGIERLYDPLNSKNTSIPIVRLFFISKKTGVASFNVGNSLVLKNDGKGTPTEVTTKNASIEIVAKNSQDNKVVSIDKNIPNPFTITIIERSIFGKTPRLAVFSADDDNGAIEHYEVAFGSGAFHVTTSPLPLPYKLFSYTLTIKAYDYSGNVRQQQITVAGDKPYGIGLGILVLIVIFILYRLYSKVKKHEVS